MYVTDNKAIIIAANPEISNDVGNVEKHKEHAEQVGKVFWMLVPPGQRKISWKHPEIEKGYFYISGTGTIQYTFSIAKTGTVSKFIKSSLRNDEETFIPEFRKKYWDDPEYDYFFALLIENISKLDKPKPLNKFKLFDMEKSVDRVQNYVIVSDKEVTA